MRWKQAGAPFVHDFGKSIPTSSINETIDEVIDIN